MVWTLRITLLILFGTLLYIYILNIVRFFRPTNAKAMITGPLPRLRQVGGKIAGVEATASLADANAVTAGQMADVRNEIRQLTEQMVGLATQVERLALKGEADDHA